MTMTTEILVPDIGDFADVEIIEVLVSPGDTVDAEDSLITVESDKASMEIPTPSAGEIVSVAVSVGDRVSEGSLLVTLEESGDTSASVEEEIVEARESDEAFAVADAVENAPAVTESPQAVELNVPDIGDFNDVEVIEVLVSTGDTVEKEQSLITLESDKASMEIPSTHAGTIESVAVSVGDRVSEGDVFAMMTATGAAAAPAASKPASVPAPQAAASEPLAPGDTQMKPSPVEPAPPERITGGKAHASPAIRQFARELGVDVSKVVGTGLKGRITKEDVQNHIKRVIAEHDSDKAKGGFGLPEAPDIDFSKWGEIEEVELGRIKKLSGAHLHRAWLTIPHVTQFDDADITELEAFRKESKARAEQAGIKLTFMPFLLKACATALKTMPEFNASLTPDGERLILKKYVNIGIAVDTPNGLVVPVVKNVDKKGIFEIGAELMEISANAREGKLKPSDMQGGCFSISSLGGIGGTQFAPIVNSPEVAILGVSKAKMKPVWDGSEFQPRLIMPFSLSYDHRVIDGAQGVRFTTYLGDLLDDIRHLLL
ncbi:dihydrolipoyllysine-residue acetyltransferase [Solemya velum gill symbiont]|uniref:Acetyltransferase component of pyruvate dehydrogenase complex n=2 Tax=Solemya velum gill symbiont TaxID=2340 RepID=A0A1T2CIQ8_SOVGS|nr:dihydrolipoyllysine-residue acetyltransferase [Solemya velum gill symbiont]OOY37473.1 dihydrolipoyllysine-residue acetyltransferase [Solemya velum gill symbiont]OOY43161.1 dihydrolipoyllysine-residue acetyltransferase [Solemya velum gill symbiont]OOY47505.1 dihydrolipoyllysine-residue acetyltransferase [Solemya velum gill symbiont]OOY47661.1 dihydrolipoyllysine-residue acetyltransferase [Solemya velum gill symbiont]